jgi:hypothetical protein
MQPHMPARSLRALEWPMAGIGVIGVFTATIATLFFEQEKESELAAMAARLNAIDQK